MPKVTLDSDLIEKPAEISAKQTKLLQMLRDNLNASELLFQVAEFQKRLSDLVAEKRDAA